ncbi:olfactory receptor 8S1-like [Panthera tigris]|uniref:olfactory receptor 8S1-like n=1 Tax=Panthera tigris TaxID=9694 RepID=UPI001C6F64A2|nr:olfactory receptor 8S1-like [Panthera tigris]
MKNVSMITEFVLLGLSSDPQIQTMLFVLFLGIYLLTLVGNLVMILVIRVDPRLHTPMYFFLGHLSFLDLSFSSVTVPKMLQNFLSQNKSISMWGCITQSFFFTLSGGTEACLLSAMAYDRYAAICHPLVYTMVINRPLCIVIVSIAWTVGFLISLLNSLFIHKLYFCRSNIILHFSCELPPLFPLSCTDPIVNEILLAVSCAFLGLLTLPLILFSYSRIISAILNIRSSEGQAKAFSTCSSHLTVVLLFYGTALFRYISPASGSVLERVVSIQYSVITSLLNPLIYSLKNQEVKAALQRMLKQQKCASCDCLAYNDRLLNVGVINEPVCKEPRGRPRAGTENGQSGSGRGWAATVGWIRRPGAAGAEVPGSTRLSDGGRGGHAPEAGGDFLCPPHPRPPGRRLRPSLAQQPAAPTKRRAEGRGRRRPGGRHGPQAKPTGVSGAEPQLVAAGGRDARLPGKAGGGLVTHGAGRRIDAASGRCLNRGVGPTDILCPAFAQASPSPASLSGPAVPAAVTRAQVTPWLLSLDLLLPQFTGNLFSDLTSPAPAQPLGFSEI